MVSYHAFELRALWAGHWLILLFIVYLEITSSRLYDGQLAFTAISWSNYENLGSVIDDTRAFNIKLLSLKEHFNLMWHA